MNTDESSNIASTSVAPRHGTENRDFEVGALAAHGDDGDSPRFASSSKHNRELSSTAKQGKQRTLSDEGLARLALAEQRIGEARASAPMVFESLRQRLGSVRLQHLIEKNGNRHRRDYSPKLVLRLSIPSDCFRIPSFAWVYHQFYGPGVSHIPVEPVVRLKMDLAHGYSRRVLHPRARSWEWNVIWEIESELEQIRIEYDALMKSRRSALNRAM